MQTSKTLPLSSFFTLLALSVIGCGDDTQLETKADPVPNVNSADVTDPVASGTLPNPISEVVKGWGPLPDRRSWGSTAGVDIDPKDGHIWAYDRCGAYALDGGCEVSDVDPVLKFDRNTGEVLATFGSGLFVLPHGIHVDAEGDVWITDSMGNQSGTKGHQAIKFSPQGEVLLTLGKAGVAGSGPSLLNEPCDVITAPNGDIFVSDGHSGQMANPPAGTTGRIIKYNKAGEYITEWGQMGSGPGEFRTPHALAFDSQGRLFVADRGNNRIQIYDQDGNYIDSYYQFGRISGLFIDGDDTLYAIDSESRPAQHGDWSTGIRIGHASRDEVTAFVPPHESDIPQGAAGEAVAVDADRDIYAAEGPYSREAAEGGLTKYIRR